MKIVCTEHANMIKRVHNISHIKEVFLYNRASLISILYQTETLFILEINNENINASNIIASRWVEFWVEYVTCIELKEWRNQHYGTSFYLFTGSKLINVSYLVPIIQFVRWLCSMSPKPIVPSIHIRDSSCGKCV